MGQKNVQNYADIINEWSLTLQCTDYVEPIKHVDQDLLLIMQNFNCLGNQIVFFTSKSNQSKVYNLGLVFS